MTPKTVYVVDDEDAIRRSLRLMLHLAGWSVSAFPSGTAFLEEVPNLPSACVLLDVRMPDVDGFAVQNRLVSAGNRSPVIVMTGHGELSSAVDALRAGAIDFLEKPFERNAVLASLDRGWLKLNDPPAYDALCREAAASIAALSEREQEVLRAFADGLTNRQASAALALTIDEIEQGRATLIERLGAASLTDAVRIAYLGRSARH